MRILWPPHIAAQRRLVSLVTEPKPHMFWNDYNFLLAFSKALTIARHPGSR
jgi:hypothetical protein